MTSVLAATVTAPAAPPTWMLLVAGCAALAGAAVLAWEAMAGRPRRPRATRARMELGDDPEPPALVGFLLDDYEVPAETAPATLLDLAARGHLRLEQHGDQVLCRLRPSSDEQPVGALEDYERKVLDHVRRRAVDGVLPAAVLSTGPAAASARWWRGLRRAVIAHAQREGLCRRRWRRGVIALAGLPVAVAVIILWVADQPADAAATATPAGALVTFGTVALLAALGAAFESDRQTSTDAGLRVASRWLEVHDFLADRADLGDMPPGGVVIWGRHLAFAAVMGLAPAAVRGLPLGEDDPRHAWSRVDGRWRPVTIQYPWWRPGWGMHPLAAAARSLVVVAVTGTVAWVGLRAAADPGLLWDAATTPAWLATTAAAVGSIAAAVGVVHVLRAGAGIADLFTKQSVEGVVLRRVRGRVPDGWEVLRRLVRLDRTPRPPLRDADWVAVDDGRSDRIRAWILPPGRHHDVRAGDRVRVEVTPRLGHVAVVAVDGPRAAWAAPAPATSRDTGQLLRHAAAQFAALVAEAEDR